ncbi:MAG: hypothetical protein M3247_06130 [Thermoproteota archaeon]|jgi:hypothetical protein|nr:hypothetical protein [Thermoproteota archaeon]
MKSKYNVELMLHLSSKMEYESEGPDYDEDRDQIEEKQEEETSKMTINQVSELL